MDEHRRLVVGWSAKCGCTHLKTVLLFCLRGKFFRNPHDVKFDKPLPKSLRGWTVLIVVRSPFERLASGFLDKYRPDGQYRYLWKSKHLTFNNFVRTLAEHGALTARGIEHKHFAPQLSIPLIIRLHEARTLRVCDIGAIDYQMLSNKLIEGRPIPQTVLEWRGPHTRCVKKHPIRPGAYASADVSSYDTHATSSAALYRPLLTKLVERTFSNDLAFCAFHGIRYKRPTST